MNERPEWQEEAACRGTTVPEDFFPEDKTNVKKRIRDMCASCPVVDKCLDHALKHEPVGFWAGTSSKDRQKLRRKRGIRLNTPTPGRQLESFHRKKIVLVEAVDLDENWRDLDVAI